MICATDCSNSVSQASYVRSTKSSRLLGMGPSSWRSVGVAQLAQRRREQRDAGGERVGVGGDADPDALAGMAGGGPPPPPGGGGERAAGGATSPAPWGA